MSASTESHRPMTWPQSLLVAGLIAITSGPAPAMVFTVTDIGDFTPNAINDLGEVVGTTRTNPSRAVHLERTAPGTITTTFLDFVGWNSSQATDINNQGVIVGSVINNANNNARAFIHDFDTGATQFLGTFEGGTAFANTINESGVVGGSAPGFLPPLSGLRGTAFIFDPSDPVNAGGALGPKVTRTPLDINESNQWIADPGTFSFFCGPPNGARGCVDINTLAGVGSVDVGALNDKGQIAGEIRTASGRFLPTIFEVQQSSGVVTGFNVINLTPPGVASNFSTDVHDINNLTQVVGGIAGGATGASGGPGAFLWQNGQFTNLNGLVDTPGWTLDEAFGINEAGQVIGRGRLNGVQTAFLLDPNPNNGFLPQQPLLPVIEGPDFVFREVDIVDPETFRFIDPDIAIGYDYSISGGPLLKSVILPEVGDNLFDVCLPTAGDFDCIAALAGDIFLFSDFFTIAGDGVNAFRVLGIEESAGLAVTDPQAFVTGLNFTSGGTASITMTPIAAGNGDVPVPEPSTLALLGLGLAGMGVRRRQR